LGHERHLARERALELAYEASIKDLSFAESLKGLPIAPAPYVSVLLEAMDANHEWAKDLIVRCAFDWQYDRMPVIDRLVMIMALAEARTSEPPPRAVILDEAVELAKTFSTDSSPSFVNGVLVACFDEESIG
jgi:N utilization substance protein B